MKKKNSHDTIEQGPCGWNTQAQPYSTRGWPELVYETCAQPPTKKYVERYLRAEILQLNCWQLMLLISCRNPPGGSTSQKIWRERKNRSPNQQVKMNAKIKVFCNAWEDAEFLDIRLERMEKTFYRRKEWSI